MHFKTLFLLCGVQLIQYSYGEQNSPHFRNDYTYLEATESFYKVHTVPRTWIDAKKICANEGAMLFFSENQKETDAMQILNATTPFSSIYVGISDILSEGVYETIDGRTINDVYQKWNKWEPNNYDDKEDCVEMAREGYLNDIPCNWIKQFICKKTLVSLQWNKHCKTPFLDYEYNENLGKCYKFLTTPRNWTDAHALCVREQSYLGVINSQPEADYFFKLTERKHENKKGNYVRGTVFLGFHNQFGDGWTTVKGTPIKDAGYSSWAPQQPDGGDRAKCGSMFYSGLLNDIACDKESFFICEHDIAN